MKLTDLSPSRLVALSLAGYLIAASGFALMSDQTFAHFAHRVGFLAYFLPCLTVILLGFAIAAKAASTLADGVRLERWTPGDLRTPRRIFEHPVWPAISLLVVTLAVGVLIIATKTHHQGLDFFYPPILFFANWISGIRHSLREPRASQLRQALPSIAPLQSQHWGS